MADTKKSNLTTQGNEDLDRDYPAKERARATQGDVRVSGTDRLRDTQDTGNAPETAADEELDDEDELEEEEE